MIPPARHVLRDFGATLLPQGQFRLDRRDQPRIHFLSVEPLQRLGDVLEDRRVLLAALPVLLGHALQRRAGIALAALQPFLADGPVHHDAIGILRHPNRSAGVGGGKIAVQRRLIAFGAGAHHQPGVGLFDSIQEVVQGSVLAYPVQHEAFQVALVFAAT